MVKINMIGALKKANRGSKNISSTPPKEVPKTLIKEVPLVPKNELLKSIKKDLRQQPLRKLV